jgi:predicted lipoprotein with Yx(FWY)xxD motif
MRSSIFRRGGRRAATALVGAIVAAVALLPGTAGATVIYPPFASSAVRTAEGFELRGVVYNYGGTTTYHFEYGTTTAYGTSVPVPDADAGPALSSQVSEQITGLAADTAYHWRLVSTNSVEGTAATADQTFSTATTTAPSLEGGGSGSGPAPTGPGTKPGSGTNPGPGTSPGAGTNPGAGSGGQATGPGSSPAPTVAGKGPKAVAKALHAGGQTLLTTTAGRTLYTLSAERHGKFVCTEASGCTGIWHPLTVAAGVVPQGPVKLGTIERPDGSLQVTLHGLPLYTFASDKRPGQVKGEGLKDVGTWHAAVLPSSASKSPAPSPGGRY